MSEQGDQLLYVMSAKEYLSWADFKQLFDVLSRHLEQQEQPSSLTASILWQKTLTAKNLDSLAHCDLEFGQGGGKIHIAPPLLIRVPSIGLPQAVLVGRRSPQSFLHLTQACRKVSRNIEVEAKSQNSLIGYGPKRISVRAESIGEIELVAERLSITWISEPPAWSLLHFSGGLDEYLSNCLWEAANELEWQRRDFDPEHLQFCFPSTEQEGYRLSRYTDPVRSTPVYLLWDGHKRARIDVDWGRYALLRNKNLDVLVYDKHKFILAELASVPIPRLLRRSLVLFSGYAPNFVPKEQLSFRSPDALGVNLFQEIPPQVARILADKLGQRLKTKNIVLE